jgi:hypothetical protein
MGSKQGAIGNTIGFPAFHPPYVPKCLSQFLAWANTPIINWGVLVKMVLYFGNPQNKQKQNKIILKPHNGFDLNEFLGKKIVPYSITSPWSAETL